MAKINLLPWREELRKQKTQEFGVLMAGFALVAAVIVGIAHLYHVSLIDYHNTRNAYLDDQIKQLDKKIEEIQRLEREKERLIARMRAIEQLQRNRPLIVRFFDELIANLPEGVSVLSITQDGERITINGEAQSNARVSSFMRNLEGDGDAKKQQWLKDPKLDIIQGKTASGQRVSAFTLRFTQVVPKAEDEGA
jgi:type IV pilus assembly protein PilN